MKREKLDGWLICDRGVCLYSELAATKLDRCIKHGAILTWLGWGSGRSREYVRAVMRDTEKRVAEAEARGIAPSMVSRGLAR